MTSIFPLPEGWSEPERFEDVVDIDGLALRRAGVSSIREGTEALGSAAHWQMSPAARAQFELLERVVVLEASRKRVASFPARSQSGDLLGELAVEDVFPVSPEPAVWAYARSNGVALHSDWRRACERALGELVERDRVLRAWLGQTQPVRLPFDLSGSPLARTRSYEWSVFSFPAPASGELAVAIEVAGVFGFPCKPSAPLVFGYGARDSVRDAVAAATREALQLLSFLYGEPVSQEAPEPAPTPMCHLETHQPRDRQASLRSWLGGGHRRYGGARATEPPAPPGAVSFADLTPGWLGASLRVAKAVSPAALPLTFGLSPITANLPEELRIHPIP